MSAPRTLAALRAAVARVLVARGESAEGPTVRSMAIGGGCRAVVLRPQRPGPHWLAMYIRGNTAADAIAATWAHVVERCGEERDNAEGAVESARLRLERARAALAAAREVGE